MARPALDLAGGGLRVLMRDGDRAFENAVGIVFVQPGLGQPVIKGGGDGRAEVGVGLEVAEGAGQQDGVRDAELLDQLLAQEIRVGARTAAVRGERVQPRPVHRIAEEAAPAAVPAVPEGQRHVRPYLVMTLRAGVYVAVNDAGTLYRSRLQPLALSDRRIHIACSAPY